MPTEISRDQVEELRGAKAQLVEVLPPEDYQYFHLPGAINIPLKEFSQEVVDQLDRQRPVIVYCMDTA